MTTVVFETATLADAIKAANKVAPTKGSAFDKAHGIMLEVDPASEVVTVRSTNNDLFHMAWVDTVSVSGPATSWRLPSRVITQVVSSLPIGSGKNVTFEQKDRQLHMTQGRTKARFNLIHTDDYPLWSAFDPDTLFPASDLGGKIALVEWAAAKTEVPFSGVFFDGEQVIATDRYRLARVPLKISDLKEPIVVPAGLLSSVIKQTGEVMIGTDGDQLLIMPDEHTQIRSVIYGQKYPSVDRIMKRDYPQFVEFDRDDMLQLINRTMAFEGSNRIPTLRMFFVHEEIRLMMSDEERGMLGDVLEVPGQCPHDMFEMKFTPKNLTDALSASPNAKVRIGYDPGKANGLVYIDGGSGWESWVMPRLDKGEKNG